MSSSSDNPTSPGTAAAVPAASTDASYASVTEQISSIVLRRRTTWPWIAGFGFSFVLVMMMIYSIGYLLVLGTGVWGLNVPVAWGFAIINFVWWIGIGHAGTLISAVLLLLRQSWRTSINRFAEAMTLFAVACAGMFPILHLGRPWVFYWLLPYPNTMGMWPQFRSPLVWDVFAVTTYAIVSLLFWYVGLIPDLACMRDRARNRVVRATYGFFAMGWRGDAKHWFRYQKLYLLLAGLATPLVVSVHSIVGLDFATSILPGWHVTLFPPYFVAGAIYSGFAMVVTLSVPLRAAYGLEDVITKRHLDNMGKIMLASGLMVVYGYAMENFFAWYSGNPHELSMLHYRLTGAYAPAYWSLLFCNVGVLQFLWSRRIRRSPWLLFGLSLVANVGMWLERFVIVVTTLSHDFLPSSWDGYVPTFWDWSLFVGTLGFFVALLFLFIRVLPMISIFEMRELVHHRRSENHHATGSTDST